MLSDGCLSVLCHLCVCLSITFVQSVQMAGWIKMLLGTKVGLSLSDSVLYGDPAPPAYKEHEDPLQCLTDFYCGQTARCINMPLAMEVGLSPEDFMLHAEPSLSPSKTRMPASDDRTACRQFQSATHVLPIGVGPFAFRYQGNGGTPCQYIDTTQKAIDCATTLPVTVFDPNFEDVRGGIEPWLMASWKARVRLPIGHN